MPVVAESLCGAVDCGSCAVEEPHFIAKFVVDNAMKFNAKVKARRDARRDRIEHVGHDGRRGERRWELREERLTKRR